MITTELKPSSTPDEMDSNPHSHTLQKHSKENTGSFQGINRHTLCVSAKHFQKDKKSRRKTKKKPNINRQKIQ